jgi:hypothetical protein
MDKWNHNSPCRIPTCRAPQPPCSGVPFPEASNTLHCGKRLSWEPQYVYRMLSRCWRQTLLYEQAQPVPPSKSATGPMLAPRVRETSPFWRAWFLDCRVPPHMGLCGEKLAHCLAVGCHLLHSPLDSFCSSCRLPQRSHIGASHHLHREMVGCSALDLATCRAGLAPSRPGLPRQTCIPLVGFPMLRSASETGPAVEGGLERPTVPGGSGRDTGCDHYSRNDPAG